MKKLERPKCEACPKTLVVVPLLLPHHKRTRWPCCLLVEFHLLANFRDRKERRRQRRWWVLLYREREKHDLQQKRTTVFGYVQFVVSATWTKTEKEEEKNNKLLRSLLRHIVWPFRFGWQEPFNWAEDADDGGLPFLLVNVTVDLQFRLNYPFFCVQFTLRFTISKISFFFFTVDIILITIEYLAKPNF